MDDGRLSATRISQGLIVLSTDFPMRHIAENFTSGLCTQPDVFHVEILAAVTLARIKEMPTAAPPKGYINMFGSF